MQAEPAARNRPCGHRSQLIAPVPKTCIGEPRSPIKNAVSKEGKDDLLQRGHEWPVRSLDVFFVNPMAAVVTPPEFSKDKAACDRSPRHNHRPQMPCLSPRRLRAQAQHLQIYMALGCHLWCSRQASHDRPRALPRGLPDFSVMSLAAIDSARR